MSEGPTIGDWTQYGWIPDGASSFPAMVRLRNAAWMVYYEPGTVVQRERAENAKLRELVRDMWRFTGAACKRYPRLFDQSAQGGQMVMPNMLDSFERRMRELGIEVDA